jgi:hypothetical protein
MYFSGRVLATLAPGTGMDHCKKQGGKKLSSLLYVMV